MSNQLSNGLLARRRRINPVVLNELSFINSAANSLGSSVTCPATQAGDILLFWQGHYQPGLSSLVTPSGFSLTGNATGESAYRSVLFHKVATGTEGGTTLSGLSGNGTYGVIVAVFRANVPVTGVVANSVNTQTSGPGVGTSQTVPSGGGSAPILAVGGGTTASRSTTFSPQTARISVNSGFGALCYNIQNSTPANVSLSTNASNPGVSAVVGCFFTFTI